MATQDLMEMAQELQALRDYKEDVKTTLQDLEEKIRAAEERIVDEMIGHEIQRFTTQDGATFYLRHSVHVSDVAGARPTLHKVLTDMGHGDLVKQTVHPQTLGAFVREQMAENGGELPGWLDGLVRVYETDKIAIRKGNG